MAYHSFIWLAVFATGAQGVLGVFVNGSSYDETEAKMFASLASMTYCDDMQPILKWTCTACADSKTPLVEGKIKIVDQKSVRVVVGKLKDQSGCLVAFRGSHNVLNWIDDFKAWEINPSTYEECDGCKVHSGFYNLWKNLRGSAVTALKDVGCQPTVKNGDNLLYVTGHSLGAALTHLAMFTLENAGFQVAKSYSFEAPRVGNKAFSDAFSSRFTRKFPVYRLTHYMDPVVHLPPNALSYTHVQTEVYYDNTGKYKICANSEDKSCADHYPNLPLDLLHVSDHCDSPLVPNGDICKPVGCGSSNVEFPKQISTQTMFT